MTEEVKEGWNKLKLGEVVKINKKSIAVGAINNTFFPAIISGIALIWGSIGTAKPFSRMAFWTGLENEENTVVGGICSFCDTFILLFVISKRCARE